MEAEIIKRTLDSVMEAYARHLRRRYISHVSGTENLPDTGAFLLAFNHDSFMDPFYIWSILYPDTERRRVFFIAQINPLLNTLVSKLLRNYAVTLLIDPSSKARVVESAIERVAQGQIVAVTPEGIIKRSPTLRKGKTGAARIALEAGVCVVPVGIRTEYYVWHIRDIFRWLVRRKTKAVITIGEALHFDHLHGKPPTEQLLNEVIAAIMREIGKLCGKDYITEAEISEEEGTELEGQAL